MPLYEYYCSRCAAKFELLRPLSRIDEAATCPAGHGGATRALSMFAVRTDNAGSWAGDSAEMPSAGGGCACGGGGCGCGH